MVGDEASNERQRGIVGRRRTEDDLVARIIEIEGRTQRILDVVFQSADRPNETDAGDGRGTLAPQASSVAQVFYNVQTFPLTYQTPLVRVSVKLTEKLRYNLGYQYYGYHEDFGVLSVNQNYRAHTGYTSLLWSF